eukprot:TRINITY_DN12952_c0_g1_i2.p1 TRINITY_DN12952_c0_g1~~TRINITY_DN12952_c0_g1_i2.p1  ORF type:complete len:153 (+),score=10.47 TRINITY_DN12952_c0_g1_i2:171-629(+)
MPPCSLHAHAGSFHTDDSMSVSMYSDTNSSAIGSCQDLELTVAARLSETGKALPMAWFVIRSLIPLQWLRRSLLCTIRKSSSCCTGVYTGEMGLALVQKTVNDSCYLDALVDIQTVTAFEMNERCHQLIHDNALWCNAVTDSPSPQPCLFKE